jgi:hypothetical protein
MPEFEGCKSPSVQSRPLPGVDSRWSCIAARKQAVIERSCKVKSEILRAEILRPRWQHNRWM